MRIEKRHRLGFGHALHAVRIVVAVALDVRDADERGHGRILLHADPGLGGQILGGHEIALFAQLRIPRGTARGVDQPFIYALAAFVGNAAIAEVAGAGKGIEGAVGLVDDHRAVHARRGNLLVERNVPVQRLFEELAGTPQPLQLGRARDGGPERGHTGDIRELLAAVDGHGVRLRAAVENRRNAFETRERRIHIIRNRDLEMAAAIGRDGVLEGDGQAVMNVGLSRAIRVIERVDHAHGVAHGDRLGNRPVGHKGRHVEIVPDETGKVGAHRFEDGTPLQAAKRIEHRAIQQGGAETGDQAVHAHVRALRHLIDIAGRRELPRRCRAGLAVEPGGLVRGGAQMGDVLLVAQVRRLVKPLRHQHLGSGAPGFAAVVALHQHPREGLRRLAQGDHAEAEGQAQANRPLVEPNLQHCQTRCVAHFCPPRGRHAAFAAPAIAQHVAPPQRAA